MTYVGELGYELHVPAEYAPGVYDELMAAGADLGVRPVGLRRDGRACGWRRATATSASTSTTPTTPLEAGLGVRRGVGQAGRLRRPRGAAAARALPARRAERVVSSFVDDPSVDLFGNEPVLLDGAWAGYVRAPPSGTPSAVRSRWRRCRCDDGVTGDWLRGHAFERMDARPAGEGQVQARAVPHPAPIAILA